MQSLLVPLALVASMLGPMTGEVYNFRLNKSKVRTSKMIKDGSLKLTVSEVFDHFHYGETQKLTFDIIMDIRFAGRQKSVEYMNIPTYFFKQPFWESLKVEKTAVLPDFKVRFIESVSDLCNKVELFDVKESSTGSYKIKNMKIKTTICTDQEGIGADYLDISGNVSIYKFRSGFDLIK